MTRFIWPRLLQAAVLTALIFAILSTGAIAGENLTVSFLDVGQGDSELLQFAGHNVLIDGGTQEMGPRVEGYLRGHGVPSLDLLVATHPHEDHIGGLLTILRDFPVGQILDSGQVHTAPSFESYLRLVDQKGIPFQTAQRGQTIYLDPRLKIEVLSPPTTPFLGDDLNQNSVVLRVTYNKVSFLFMGDAGFTAEDSLLSSGINLNSDILKVGHHGSSSASSAAFLNAVNPQIKIIEVGAGNDYGHPSKKTLNALQRTGSKIYRTDTDGNIVVTTDGQSYSVTTEKSSRATTSIVPRGTGSAVTVPTVAAVTTATTSDGPFVGSTKSDKYHYPTCNSAKKIKSTNIVTFASSAEARAAGYVPCGICHPP